MFSYLQIFFILSNLLGRFAGVGFRAMPSWGHETETYPLPREAIILIRNNYALISALIRFYLMALKLFYFFEFL